VDKKIWSISVLDFLMFCSHANAQMNTRTNKRTLTKTLPSVLKKVRNILFSMSRTTFRHVRHHMLCRETNEDKVTTDG